MNDDGTVEPREAGISLASTAVVLGGTAVALAFPVTIPLVLILGFALAASGSNTNRPWLLFHAVQEDIGGAGSICVIVHVSNIWGIDSTKRLANDVRLIGAYITKEAAMEDGAAICGPNNVSVENAIFE